MAYQRKYFSTQSICPFDRANINLTLPKWKTCSWRSWKDTFCTALARHKLDKAMCSQRKIYRLSPTARPDVPRKCLDERHENTIFVQPWQSSSVCYQLFFRRSSGAIRRRCHAGVEQGTRLLWCRNVKMTDAIWLVKENKSVRTAMRLNWTLGNILIQFGWLFWHVWSNWTVFLVIPDHFLP